MTSREQRIVLWSGALVLGAGAIYFNYHNLRNKFWPVKEKETNMEEEEEEKEKEVAYEYKGLDRLGEYELTDITKERVQELKSIYIHEKTPDGNVVMNYNYETENFEYFSDNAIAYKYLETVARLYVMENNCCRLYVVLWDELVAGWRKMKGLDASGNDIEESKEGALDDGPFATLKNYKENESKKMLLIDKSNTYKHVEKIAVYDEMIFRKNQNRGDDSGTHMMTFTEWKNSLLQKQEAIQADNDAEKLKNE